MKGRWLSFSILLTLITWVGTYLPWVSTTGAAFSSNLYDLAEWTSLHPAVRGGNPPLLATLLLRLVPALLALCLAVYARKTHHLTGVLALLIGIGLLPPFDFFRGQSGDPNYRQQFVIALLTCAGVVIVWWHTPRILILITAMLGVVCGAAGLFIGLSVLSTLGLHVAPGAGGLITIFGMGIIPVGITFIRVRKRL